jgi:hypothetical protein
MLGWGGGGFDGVTGDGGYKVVRRGSQIRPEQIKTNKPVQLAHGQWERVRGKRQIKERDGRRTRDSSLARLEIMEVKARF